MRNAQSIPLPIRNSPPRAVAVISTAISTVLARPCYPRLIFHPSDDSLLLAGAVFHLISDRSPVSTGNILCGKGSPRGAGNQGGRHGLGGIIVPKDFPRWMWPHRGCGEVINPLSGPGVRNILLLQTAPSQNCYFCSTISSWIFQGLGGI